MPDQPHDDERAEPAVTLNAGPEGFLPYLGKCVAIVNGEVAAVGDDWNALVAAVREKHLVDPLLMFVPAQPVCA